MADAPLINMLDVPLRVFDEATSPIDAAIRIFGTDHVRAATPTLTDDGTVAAIHAAGHWWSVHFPISPVASNSPDAWTGTPYYERAARFGRALSVARYASTDLTDLVLALADGWCAPGAMHDWDNGLLAIALLDQEMTAEQRTSIEVLFSLRQSHVLPQIQDMRRIITGWPHRDELAALSQQALTDAADHLHVAPMPDLIRQDVSANRVLSRLMRAHDRPDWPAAVRHRAYHIVRLHHLRQGDLVTHPQHGTGPIEGITYESDGTLSHFYVHFPNENGLGSHNPVTSNIEVLDVPPADQQWLGSATPVES